MATENTTHAISLCSKIYTTNAEVDEMMKNMLPKKREEAIHAQIKHWKTANKGGIPKDTFYLTKAGKKLSVLK